MGVITKLDPRRQMIAIPGPQKRAKEHTDNMRIAMIADVRSRLADQSRISVTTWLYVGKSLIDVRDTLAGNEGAFKALFAADTKQQKDERRFPFSHTTARHLICIAQSAVASSDTEQREKLPSGWMTLYELSKLTTAKLTSMIESGAIHPMMTRAQAKSLAGAKAIAKKPVSERTFDSTYMRFKELVKRFERDKRIKEMVHLMYDVLGKDARAVAEIIITEDSK